MPLPQLGLYETGSLQPLLMLCSLSTVILKYLKLVQQFKGSHGLSVHSKEKFQFSIQMK